MRVLLIEDDEDKAKRVGEFLTSEFPDARISLARSFNSGLRSLIADSANLDILLLDMTMTSYDVTPDEPTGGAPEHFAGRDMLAQMKLRRIQVPTIVVTMFDSFEDGPRRVSLGELVKQLRTDYSPSFIGHVYYNATQESWKADLRAMITQAKAM